MLNLSLKPMGIGRILDRSFQLYRKHFVKLTLIMLILYGPYYLLQNLLLYQETAFTTSSILNQIREGASWQDILQSSSSLQDATSPAEIAKNLLFVFLLLPIFLLGLMPASVASTIHLIRAELFGEEVPGVGGLLKKSFRRFWPMVGSTVINLMIMVGIYFGFVIVMMLLAVAFIFGAGVSGSINGSVGGGAAASMIIFFILLFIGFLLTFSYFFIRWGYYLAVVASGEDLIGLGQSWRLTRKQFWRLFLMYFVLVVILYLFLTVVQLLVTAVLGAGLFAQLLGSLLSILISPLWLLPYALSYFDLKVRNEGLGLEAMIESVVHNQVNGMEGLSGSEWKDGIESINPVNHLPHEREAGEAGNGNQQQAEETKNNENGADKAAGEKEPALDEQREDSDKKHD
ncbi:hypothetical protein [Paenibacillus hexagrammi]|uniref:Glycerophosphoryl diester phosphodiesterase membrane domain-containing protein n=1 Tax=Paenibacillus hexagrammi TaxID=2908839 RepID=A0ABY3SHB4_9BACL|nr:hypothetical protein [Paenibacillus sp. YPD9-1]UJF32581.1 hypothetical protein L0M14_23500 [Paenibacillus sp. YPD9-1]